VQSNLSGFSRINPENRSPSDIPRMPDLSFSLVMKVFYVSGKLSGELTNQVVFMPYIFSLCIE